MTVAGRIVVTVGGVVAGLLLVFLSLPWILWAIGRGTLGDADGYERALNRAPVNRFLTWVERRAA